MKRAKWIRLKEGNDWGHVYYCEDPLNGPAQTADYARGYRFVSGETLRVRVGDKRKRCLDGYVTIRRKRIEVADMGHAYVSYGDVPMIIAGRAPYRPDEVDIDQACLEGRPLNEDLSKALDDDSIAQTAAATRNLPSLESQGLGWLLKFGSARVPP